MQYPILFMFFFAAALGCQSNSSDFNPTGPAENSKVSSVASDLASANEIKTDTNSETNSKGGNVLPVHASAQNNPLKAWDKPSFRFQLSADKEQHLFLETGTEIYIPSGAFLHLNGKPASGMVRLDFKEWHSLSEIFVSGIPMEFSENGQEGALSSDGMFEIHAHQGGKKLKMNPEAPIVVHVASTRKENNFLNLSLNPASQEWEVLGTAAPAEPKVKISTYTKRFEKEIMHPYFVFLRQEPGKAQRAILRFQKWKLDSNTKFINEISSIAQCKFHEINLSFTEVQDLLIKTTADSSNKETGKYRFDFLDFTAHGQVVLGKGEKQCTLSVQPAPEQGLSASFYSKFLRSFQTQSPVLYNPITGNCYNFNGKDMYIPPSVAMAEQAMRPFVLDGFGIKNIDQFVPLPNQLLVNPKLPFNRKNTTCTYYVADLKSKVIWKMPAEKLVVNAQAPYKIWAISNSEVFVAENLILSETKEGCQPIQVDFVPIPLAKLLKQLDNEVVMVGAGPAR